MANYWQSLEPIGAGRLIGGSGTPAPRTPVRSSTTNWTTIEYISPLSYTPKWHVHHTIRFRGSDTGKMIF